MDVHLRENPTLKLFLCDGIVAAGGHIVLKSSHCIAAGGHFGRKSHHFFDVAMRLAYHFLRLNSALYHGNGNAAGGSQRGRQSAGGGSQRGRQSAGSDVRMEFGCSSPEVAGLLCRGVVGGF